jgi:hypothetical protein
MALTPPFSSIKCQATPNVGSSRENPTIIYGSQAPAFIDSILLCNTTDNDFFFDIRSLVERTIDGNPVSITTYVAKKRLLKANESLGVVIGDILNMESGDVLLANSDFSGNFFDSHVSYRPYYELQEENA